jgi:hypothetical protein
MLLADFVKSRDEDHVVLVEVVCHLYVSVCVWDLLILYNINK